MEHEKRYIAVDLGAESGRVMLGSVSAERISLWEIHRFSNGPIETAEGLRWDFDKLFSEAKTGIAEAVKQSQGRISGIAVDSWGVDFGLLGADGRLVGNPYHYRDSRTDGVMDRVFELMDKREIYANSGIQFMQINTIYQLLSMRLANPKLLHKAKTLVLMADLVAYYLCGKAFAGYTLASTSQLMDMRNGQWSAEIFDRLKLPIEATSSGNILMQAKATGQIESVGQIRRIVGRSFDIKRYEPADRALWSEHYKKVKEEYGCQ